MIFKDRMKDLVTTGKDFVASTLAQWKTPAKGNYVSTKEILNYGINGMGRDMLLMLVAYLGMGIGNTLFGSVLNIRPMHIQTMNTILLIVDIFFIGLRAKIIDNTNTKLGRFKPYIILVPIPLFIISTIYMFSGVETMQYSQKIVMTFCFALGVMIVRPYFDGSVTNLGNVITPNTQERTKVLTVFALIYSIAPTIYGFFIPILSNFTGGYTSIETYKYIMVPIAFLGVILSILTAFGCKERFIVPKGYKPKAKVFKTTLEVFKNKYWWIRTLSNWLAFMEWSVGNIFMWSFIYGSQDMTSYAIFKFFVGESALIAMLITPFLLRKLGNRKVILIQNVLNIVFLSIIAICFKNPFIFFIFWLLNSLVNYFAVVYSPVFSAEINDYQHYISGKRVDGAMSFAYLIGLPITILTGYFAPAIFESVGITTNYDILFEPMVRNKIFAVLCTCGIIGAVLNLAPQFFYDFSRSKHRFIVRILRYRAMLSDYASGDISSQTIKDGLEGYYEYQKIIKAELPDLKISKQLIKSALALPKGNNAERTYRKKQIKLAKIAYSNAKILKEEKKESKLYYKELHKYDVKALKDKIIIAKSLTEKDINTLHTYDVSNILAFKSAISESKEEKLYRKQLLCDAKNQAKMAKLIKKHYPKGIVEPNKQDYINAQYLPHSNKKEISIRYKAIKKASVEQKIFNKVLDYYLESKRLVDEYESRVHFDVIENMYEQAILDVENSYTKAKEKASREKLEKKQEVERLKQIRFNKFSQKKKDRIIDHKNKQESKQSQKIAKTTKTNEDDNNENQ